MSEEKANTQIVKHISTGWLAFY